MNGPISRRALLKVGYSCNNNCVFCHSAPHRGLDSDLAQIRTKIREAASLGSEMLVLSGGEATIRTDLMEIADEVSKNGMRLGLVTNGRMLVYQNLTDRLIERGLEYVYFSLCGAEAALHDRHAGADAFAQTMRGLAQVTGRVPELTINVVVTAWNLGHLADFLSLAAGFSPIRLKFSMIEPEGNVLADFEGLVPKISRTAAIVRELAASLDPDSGVSLVMDGFPLCLIPDDLDLDCGLREDRFFIMSEAFEKSWYPVDERHKEFGSFCGDCSYRRRCKGVFKQYLRRRGEAELMPVSRPISNSFNFMPYGQVETIDLRSCPIRSKNRVPPDPVRGILVETAENRVQRYHATTRDFSDESLCQAVRGLGQVYRDMDDSALITNFPRQLHRLRLHAACKTCNANGSCGGVWQATRESPFERADEFLTRLLASVSGRVLDVGCGLVPYLEVLRPALEEGTLDYLGIDPYQLPEESGPNTRLLETSLEDFDWDGDPFDTILALRSLNHLASVNQAIKKLSGLIRDGGRLILAEDTVFGIIRTARKLKMIEDSSSLPFEHRFNLTLDEAVSMIERHGLQVDIKKSPRETSSTLWIAVGYKPGE